MMINEKKKVLGKGKKIKDIAGIRKLDPSRSKISEDDYSRKLKSLKILHQDFSRKSNTPTPQSFSKNNFFQRSSESSHPNTQYHFSKRKSLPSISEISEIYVKSLHTKLEKYKGKSQSLEEEVKTLESKYISQQISLHSQIDSLLLELRLQKEKSNDQQIVLQQEVLKLRKENEESAQLINSILSSLQPLLSSHLDAEGSEKLLNFINSSSGLEQNEYNKTGTFNSINSAFSSSREGVKQNLMQALVLTDYTPQSQGELQLKSGDFVLILNSDEYNNWWLGKVGEKIGVFPRHHVMLD